MTLDDDAVVERIRDAAVPLDGSDSDYDRLIEMVGDARVVLLGESTHGTREFYHERARITRRLIEEHGFTTVAVEADWPDAYLVNRYVRGDNDDGSAEDALGDFTRFPRWMWRNTETVALVEWLREHNRRSTGTSVGFYGLDLYSLHSSIEAVLAYLEEADPDGAARARERYACFDHFGDDAQSYGYAAGLGISQGCEDQAVQQLREMQRHAAELAAPDVGIPADEHFFAEQNARLVKNAEEYYRSMFRGRDSTWNLRDCHMADTLEALLGYFDAKGERTRVVVWEHNSHIGDARATQMGEAGEWNVGQLARERFGGDAVLVGFTTSVGTVTAAHDWDGPAERKEVRPPLPGSVERLFHATGIPRFFLPLRDGGEVAGALREPRLERAIGVIYRPQTERQSHYFEARLADQFDAVVHVDRTRALQPLDRSAGWDADDAPDTFPFAV
jgi:erythromycin esterase-like protein